jgi:acyl-CoA synthetase (AMP-forming)/AMP-acid ligase II
VSSPIDFLQERFAAHQDRIAFIVDGDGYSYGWIAEQVPVYERFLESQGIVKGDIVVVVADYSPEVFCFLLACINRAVIVAPLTNDSVVEKQTLLDISECGWFLEFSPEIGKISVERLDRQPMNDITTRFLRRGLPGLLLFSSGSTGQPKGMLLDFTKVLQKFRIQREPIVAISFLLLDHFGGINTLLHITSSLGTVVTVKDRTVPSIFDAISKYKVELLPTTPSFLNVLVHSDLGSRWDFSSLRTISYGTEVMPQPTLDRLKRLFPDVKLQQTYGLSELGVLRSQSRPDGSLWVKLGGQGFQTQVVDNVLWIRSEYAMEGYLNAPYPFDADGWFNTQDRVEVDGEYFRILGRITDLINVGGQKVYPAEIETVIMQLENIEDVRVFAEANPILGNMVVAEVVTHVPENQRELKRRVRKQCAQELSAYKVPSKVIRTDSSIYSSRHKKIRASS